MGLGLMFVDNRNSITDFSSESAVCEIVDSHSQVIRHFGLVAARPTNPKRPQNETQQSVLLHFAPLDAFRAAAYGLNLKSL